MNRLLLSFLTLLAHVSSASAQDFAPPTTVKPTQEQLDAIRTRAAKLEQALRALRRQGVRDPMLAEIEIYGKAAEWIVRHGEFYQKEAIDWTLAALDRGMLRATQQAGGETPWFFQTGHPVIRAYRSRLDNSVQPYAVTFPADFGKDPRKRWRLDIVLHGRNAKLTEVSFLQQFNGDKTAPKDRDYVQIDIYGRGNNAYRWAGESDVNEAIESFLATERLLRRDLIDPARIVLRGFSMGGAGTWHLGLHRPDRWTVIGPGAGFTTTKGYVKNLPKLPDYQEACLHIYDAVDYAENAFHVPVVAYGDSEDPQLQAARNIEAKLKPLDIPMTLLVGDKLAHSFPPAEQARAEAEYAKHLKTEKPEYAKKVRFVTYTLKYNTCEWVEIIGLQEHYKRTFVEAVHEDNAYKIKTENVRALHVALPPGAGRQIWTLTIDQDKVEARPYLNQLGELHFYLERMDGRWQAVLPQKLLTDRVRSLQKVSNLQGPIDDAFTGSFLCVRGTGKAWHEKTQEYADADLKRFQAEWDKYLRGTLPVKDDEDVTPEDIATKHLILFGDPGSNQLLAQMRDRLPVQWTQESIVLGDRKVPTSTHVPAFIYPSPLNAERYIVVNSGHTFHAADFQGTNASLFPRLGDYALLRPTPTEKESLAVEVVTAGLFDEFWRVKK